MTAYTTKFGSLKDYEKGSIQIVQGEASNYAFSNVFEVAEHATAYDKIVVGLNQKYVIETVRAEGQSVWYTASHDEFVVVMDGEIRVDFLKLKSVVNAEIEGTQLAGEQPDGIPMGYVVLKKGHQAILPVGSAYRFEANDPSVLLIQTIKGPLSLEKWSEICLK
ncbi:hydroxyquinol 1,2-dioxygenase [Acinetobacter rudis]|uniref:Hydroxyquinol 1,2-dioxygenase n=1 Tax=Acinetobacter rudis TaxID=632955 RepID=A0AAW8J8T9_9GAMM|nr:hydroxyquinol 1,2-dioxygenase [Acinetobacter rudis]MDQ8935591.1 hydroxyquinol 1,2-dioxygenase [Acinetobacter rudis]MDQ9017854.1 hydroxyquinol 1,2-dioxygenase [Acinetobacter rudis]